MIAQLTKSLSPNGDYRDPDQRERSAARRAARALLSTPGRAGEADPLLKGLGFAAHHGVDPATGRACSLYLADGSDRRTWGVILVDRTAAARTVIEVPHPGFDINTEKLGLALQRRVPGSILLVAGAHRQAAEGAADVAHNDRSLFHVLAVTLGAAGLSQIQLHGFADRNLPTSDAVVSTGSAPTNKLASRIADELSDLNLRTCRVWERRCGQLEGRTNQQGRAAADDDGVFVHLELSWTVRRDAAASDRVVAAMAAQLTDG
ncbi:hypothetical protein [Micromonospora lutea]|uniref:Uncharacterized protein n=1 Tax=Micromonospora lutea TaxID=419825 RepID=A0ABQ4IWN8_9ACTN|nr:hypothetical protein [Micromonospora lutea]GIJ22336.1 hypothetical protein Vlu01_29600 [Micromonospora lutea]